MEYKYRYPYNYDDELGWGSDDYSVASASECTGLIPSVPCSSDEVDSYSEIYDVPLSWRSNAHRSPRSF